MHSLIDKQIEYTTSFTNDFTYFVVAVFEMLKVNNVLDTYLLRIILKFPNS